MKAFVSACVAMVVIAWAAFDGLGRTTPAAATGGRGSVRLD